MQRSVVRLCCWISNVGSLPIPSQKNPLMSAFNNQRFFKALEYKALVLLPMDLYSNGKTKKWKESNLGYFGLSSVFTMHSLFHFHLSVSPVLFLIKYERVLADRMSLFSKCASSHQMTSHPQSESGNYTNFTSAVTSEKNRQESRLNVHSKYMVVYSDSSIMLENIVNSQMHPLPSLCDPNCPTLQFFPSILITIK